MIFFGFTKFFLDNYVKLFLKNICFLILDISVLGEYKKFVQKFLFWYI